MFRILPILLLLAVGNCQSDDSLTSSLIQIFGPIQTTRTPDITTEQNPIVLASQNVKEATSGYPPCKLPGGHLGECVPYYLCTNNGNVVTNLDLGICPTYVDICCTFDKMIFNDPINLLPTPKQPQREGCGWANPNGVDEQMSNDYDKNTKFAEFPWMVALLKIEPVNSNEPKKEGGSVLVYVGGGSLIHPSVVLTTAHYVASEKVLKIRAGEWNTQATTEAYPHQDRDVVSIEIHKDFIKENNFYDIAVLFLDKPLNLAPNVGVVCLPPARNPQKENTRCIAMGWGKDKFDGHGRYQVILKKIELPVVRHDVCQSSLRTTRLGKHFLLHSSFMCAGGELGKDTCTGDGGAPLSCPIENEKDRYIQSGIVAWGIGCGEDGVPGVYVDVSNLRDWIDDKVVGKGYDPRIYTY